ncbi:MAG: class I SAM-dependent methyltransferase [Myxococcota bacterium]
MSFGRPLSAGEAAMYESLVVARYMQAFGEPAVRMLIPSQTAIVAHLGCRTGYPAGLIAHQLPGCSLSGVDNSAPALGLASTKASMLTNISSSYILAESIPTPLAAGAFTHTLDLHPAGPKGDYRATFQEHQRLLTGDGQMVASLPLRGSFPEIYDMLREYALRHDQPHFGEAVDGAAGGRPNPETLSEQIEGAGFYDVDIALNLVAISFENGRDFLDDPISRLVVGPDVLASLSVDRGLEQAWGYAKNAISKYWSEIGFDLTLNIGTVSARKIPQR